MNKPNIIYIHSHDTGRYIQPFGHAVETPNLQRLAESGILFRQNFCVGPTCSPSRAALVTGCYPHENGMTGLAHRGWSPNDYSQHLIHTLKSTGYSTVLTGVQHVAAPTPERAPWEIIGYDNHLEGEPHQEAASFLKSAPQEPFFLAVGFRETHRKFPDLDDCPDDPNYCMPPPPLPDTPETRQDMARYKASVRELDRKIGIVLDALDQANLSDNTLIICTTDHGIAFPRMKCNLHDSGIGTMLIMRGCGSFAGGKVIDSMTSHLDIFPTICELLQIDAPKWLRGKSLMPLVRGETTDIHDELFSQVNYHAAYEPMRAVRTSRWKYIKRFDDYAMPIMPNCDDSLSKSVWLDLGWKQRDVRREMLFDLQFDPNEADNLADDPRYKSTLDEMRDRLDRWMTEMNDPLQNGDVPRPSGAVVNDQNALSPSPKATTSHNPR